MNVIRGFIFSTKWEKDVVALGHQGGVVGQRVQEVHVEIVRNSVATHVAAIVIPNQLNRRHPNRPDA